MNITIPTTLTAEYTEDWTGRGEGAIVDLKWGFNIVKRLTPVREVDPYYSGPTRDEVIAEIVNDTIAAYFSRLFGDDVE